jgi:type IV secretory pathway VirB10-like protein
MATNTNNVGTPGIPDPEAIQTPGISDAAKRKIFFAVVGLLVVVILANVFSPNTPPKNPVTAREQKRAAQTPTVQQVNDLKKSIDDSTRILQENLDRDNEVASQRNQQKQTLAELQAADALRDTQQQRAMFDATHGVSGSAGDVRQQAQLQHAELAYKSLFADNRVTQTGQAVSFTPNGASPKPSSEAGTVVAPDAATESAKARPEGEQDRQHKRRPLDFDPIAQPLYWLPEGTVIEAELTNRLDGDEPGPVNVMITNDIYKPGTRLVLIPQGARGLGEAREVSLLGQQRLAVAFHRILTPGLGGYGIPLDHPEPGLAQTGEAGLHDKVNNHYATIFGAALAVGAIGGLAQIGNNAASLNTLSDFRNGVSASTAQSADRILDRFLNRMPTITIREGTRVKIILTDDLAVPAYQPKEQ